MSEPERPAKRDYTEAQARDIWDRARARARAGTCSFVQEVFPPDPRGLGFDQVPFAAHACFDGAKFLGDAMFSRTVFQHGASFRLATFECLADFHDTRVQGEADFTAAKFRGDADFTGAAARFEGAARFDRADFMGVAEFESEFRGSASFWRCTFGSPASFSGARFEDEVRFKQARFAGNTFFIQARFISDASFVGCSFMGLTYMGGGSFEGAADFRGARFEKDADLRSIFLGAATFENAVCATGAVFSLSLPLGWGRARKPFLRLGAGAGAFRLAKQSATDRGDYRLAGQHHYAEQSAICCSKLRCGWDEACVAVDDLRDAWPNLRRPGHLSPAALGEAVRQGGRALRGFSRGCRALGGGVLEYVFAKSLFGYGERVRGVLIAAFVVILGLAVVYCAGGVVETTAGAESVVRGDFGSALYFSVVTFTTLGYGDLRPAPHLRWAAASEALLGAFLTALFVVVMARKFTR